MPTHRTALNGGQLAEFVSAGTKALILIADKLGPDLADSWARNGEAMQRVFLQVLAPPSDSTPTPKKEVVIVKIPHYPDGVEFDMTLDGDAPENQPLEMVRRDGYSGRWKHKGSTVKGMQTQRFKWAAVGYQYNLDAVRTALTPHGEIPEGQWREAVKQMFEPDGEHLRGIADSSWVDPNGGADFPYVNSVGDSNFVWANNDFKIGRAHV